MSIDMRSISDQKQVHAYFVVPVLGGYMNTHLAEGFFWLEYMSLFSYSLSALAKIEFEHGTPLRYVLVVNLGLCCLRKCSPQYIVSAHCCHPKRL